MRKGIGGNRKGVQGLGTKNPVSGPVVPGQHFASGKFPAGNRLASLGESKGVSRVQRALWR